MQVRVRRSWIRWKGLALWNHVQGRDSSSHRVDGALRYIYSNAAKGRQEFRLLTRHAVHKPDTDVLLS